MQFNSFIFILVFMPLILIAYFIGNKINLTWGKLILIVGSIFFYTSMDWKIFIVLGISIISNFIFAKGIEKVEKWSKILLVIPIIINVGLLIYFKYTNFIIGNINGWFGMQFALKNLVLPIGISFYTFQQIAYIIAIHNKEIKEVQWIDYFLYILYFPKILMGPLMDPVDFLCQINTLELKKINWDNIAYGIKIFSFGLFKKILIADTFAKAVSWGYANIEITTSMDWILIMLFYTFEIYFDFSGYSDMAVGTSLMLNISLPINFDSPYKAISIRDFWKRWHISLTKFFTKYIYVPLGGSRRGIMLTYFNTMVVFIVSGIWHGANWTFILWGILHGVFSIFDRIIDKKKIFEPARWLLTFVLVNFLWLLFRSDSIIQWYDIIKKICFFENTAVNDGLIKIFELQETLFISNLISIIGNLSTNIRGFWMLIFVLGASAICFLTDNNYHKLYKNSFVTMLFAAAAFIWSFISLSGESVFVYFNF